MIKKAAEVKGIYYYFLPTYTQAKKVIWDGIDSKTGFQFLDYIPKDIVESKNASEMKITLITGSIIQLVGTDKYDAVRGTNPIGCIFSEYAFQDPRAWDVVRPILDENGGWALFNSTPNGENHFYEMYRRAEDDPTWFCETLTIDDTKVISEHDIIQARHEGVDEDTIQREYYGSFSASVLGAYYGPQMKLAKDQNRITKVPIQTSSIVHTAWDLGRDDATSIWFFQQIGKEFHFVHYFEGQNEDITYYLDYLTQKKGEWKITYGTHYLPHDAESKTIAAKYSVVENFHNYGFYNTNVVERIDNVVLHGIPAVRAILGECWFDQEGCAMGIRALRSYTKKYDEKTKTFLKTPKHDEASHGADAFRTFACGWRDPRPKRNKEKKRAYNPLTGMPI